MKRKPLEAIEIICPTCGLIAELYRPRGARRPKLCACTSAERVAPSTRPRVCETCPTVLNRYNRGSQCGACRKANDDGRPVVL
jgi:hypothetical protein